MSGHKVRRRSDNSSGQGASIIDTIMQIVGQIKWPLFAFQFSIAESVVLKKIYQKCELDHTKNFLFYLFDSSNRNCNLLTNLFFLQYAENVINDNCLVISIYTL